MANFFGLIEQTTRIRTELFNLGAMLNQFLISTIVIGILMFWMKCQLWINIYHIIVVFYLAREHTYPIHWDMMKLGSYTHFTLWFTMEKMTRVCKDKKTKQERTKIFKVGKSVKDNFLSYIALVLVYYSKM